jgi:hypothetical protein
MCIQFTRLALVVTLLLAVLPAQAAPARSAATNPNRLPNTLVIGGGLYDFSKNTPQLEAIDFRLEHRWGISLLSAIAGHNLRMDSWFQIHPVLGFETTSRSQAYGFGGLAFDFLVGRHLVLTVSSAVGLYDAGAGKYQGSIVEFRSMLEAGYRFKNNMRLTAFVSHMSNAHLTNFNPGANTIGGYLHIPVNMIFSE